MSRRAGWMMSVSLLLLGVLGGAWAQVDTVQALHELRDATNAGDPQAFAEHFHEDAEVTEFGPEVQRFPGRQAIQGWAEYLAELDTHLEVWDCDGTRDTASCRFLVASDVTRRMDVGALEGTVIAQFDGALIDTFTVQFTDADLARFEAGLEEANAQLYRELNRVVLNGQDLGALDRFLADDFTDHGALPGQPPGAEGLRQTLAMLFEAFPDLEITIEHLIADGSIVIAHGTARGTHEGEFMGIAPTGEHVSWEFFDMGRAQAGRFVERWGLEDTLGLLQQLGEVPAPSGGE